MEDLELKKIRENRLDNLESTINYYESLIEKGHKLSGEQRKQLQEVADKICVFGEYGDFLSKYAQKLLEIF